jgi:hypothetical protein
MIIPIHHPWPLAPGPWPSLGPANFTSHAVQLLTASGIGAPLDQVSSTWRPCTSGALENGEKCWKHISYINILIWNMDICVYIYMKIYIYMK